jgi:hypothetical protein
MIYKGGAQVGNSALCKPALGERGVPSIPCNRNQQPAFLLHFFSRRWPFNPQFFSSSSRPQARYPVPQGTQLIRRPSSTEQTARPKTRGSPMSAFLALLKNSDKGSQVRASKCGGVVGGCAGEGAWRGAAKDPPHPACPLAVRRRP